MEQRFGQAKITANQLGLNDVNEEEEEEEIGMEKKNQTEWPQPIRFIYFWSPTPLFISFIQHNRLPQTNLQSEIFAFHIYLSCLRVFEIQLQYDIHLDHRMIYNEATNQTFIRK